MFPNVSPSRGSIHLKDATIRYVTHLRTLTSFSHLFSFYFSSGSNIAYTLLAAKAECKGEEKIMGYLKGIEKCAVSCEGKASLFAYGTNEYGENRCNSDGECKCLCETGASVDGECDQKGHNGFNLYKYAGMTLICRYN